MLMKLKFTPEEESMGRFSTKIYIRNRKWSLSFRQQLILESLTEEFMRGDRSFSSVAREVSMPNSAYYRKKAVDFITPNYQDIVNDQKMLEELFSKDKFDCKPDTSLTISDWNDLNDNIKSNYEIEFKTKNTDV